MRIWVDADACPAAVREIINRAAQRRSVETVYVANKPLPLPESGLISFVKVDVAPDEADRYIEGHAVAGDLVITQDIPLAALLVAAGIVVIDPRGDTYSQENIGERLSLRDFLQGLRENGELAGGPSAFGEREKRAFAAAFDRELTRLLRCG